MAKITGIGSAFKSRNDRAAPAARLLLFVTAGALIASCSANTPAVSPAKAATPSLASLTPAKLSTSVDGIRQVLLIDESHKDGFPTDAAKIVTITLEKDILKIQVVYQGGCQEHTFELHAESAFLESQPPQDPMYLSHDSHGDTCTENIEKLLLFDLTPLNQERNDPSERPLLLRIYGPAGGSLAKEPYTPLIEWP